MRFVKWIKWIKKGKPYKEYPGFHCGCCGKWTEEKFKIPEYKSNGEWFDTWGLCNNCRNSEAIKKFLLSKPWRQNGKKRDEARSQKNW